MSRWFRTYGFADVFDDLIVGAYPLDGDDVDALARLGIRRVLNLSEDGEYRPGEREAVQRALSDAGIVEQRLRLTDYGDLPADRVEAAVREIDQWLDAGERTYLHCRAGWQRSAAVAAGVVAVRSGIVEQRLRLTDYGDLPADRVETAVREIDQWLDAGERTYLHCRAGWQRSAAVAAGVVAVRSGIDIEEALQYVRRRKPSADPLPHQRADLRRWWEARVDAGSG